MSVNDKYLKIYQGGSWITLTGCRYSIGGDEVSKTVTMASGKVVKDVIGVRTTINAAWDGMPVEKINSLMTIVRSCGFINLEYQDVDGSIKQGYFSASQPDPEVFRFKADGTAVWHTFKVTFTAQEVS